MVEQTILLELKAVGHILLLHKAQTSTYLRLHGCRIGLLMNVNSVMLDDGPRRFVR